MQLISQEQAATAELLSSKSKNSRNRKDAMQVYFLGSQLLLKRKLLIEKSVVDGAKTRS